MTDEFIVEENTGTNRTFLVTAGILTTILILASLCTGYYLLSGPGADQSQEIAAIETQNAIIAVTNQAVTQTIAAMETEAAATDTPTPVPTDTPTPPPTDTPLPTNTRVVQEAPVDTATPLIAGTSEFTPAPEASTPTPITGSVTGGTGGTTGGTGSLPQTGIDTWGAFIATLILVGMLVAARRLRSS